MRRNVLKWTFAVGLGIMISVFFRTYVVEAFEVPTGSMLPTIQLEDRVLGEKVSYLLKDPARGDIVTFPSPTEEDTILVKRIVGLPGELVEIKDGHVYINNELLDEPWADGLTYPLYNEYSASRWQLEDDEYWVMGDNRENSADSRVFGPIHRSDIMTHVFFVFWPIDELGTI